MHLFTSAIEWFERASWGFAPLARHNFFSIFLGPAQPLPVAGV
jgi:hypothetical protein